MSELPPSILERLLVEPPFRFDMAIRKGDGTFFQNSAAPSEVIEERCRWLADTPSRYSGMVAGGEAMLEEALELACGLNPGIQVTAEDAAGRCLQLGAAWEPDFLLLRPVSGDFHLLGGCVCFPSAWALGEKLGRPLEWIHGPVPTLNADLGTKIRTFLGALKPGSDWERINWGMAATPELNLHPDLGRPRMGPDEQLGSTWLRVEHQALRCLPRSGGFVFGIRISLHPLSAVVRHPGTGQRIAALLETMPPAVAEYKGLGSARASLIEQLRSL